MGEHGESTENMEKMESINQRETQGFCSNMINVRLPQFPQYAIIALFFCDIACTKLNYVQLAPFPFSSMTLKTEHFDLLLKQAIIGASFCKWSIDTNPNFN